MSLKAFHIAFVTVSTVVAGLFTAWCVREFSVAREPVYAVGGVAAGLVTVALPVYGGLFLRKFKEIGFL